VRLALAAVLAGVAVAAGCGGSSSGSGGTTTTAAPPDTTVQSTPTAATGCKNVTPTHPHKPSFSKPATVLTKGEQATIVLDTNCGPITIRLDQARGGPIPNSIAFLVTKHFYDGLTFHRVVPGFVIQGGDPSGDGTGGPGFTVVDTPPSDAKYTKGVVAMAKTGTDPAGTSGSQFFVVSGADAGLPPEYAILGNVTDGIDVVEKIDALGTGDGPPSEKVTIDKVTLSTS
jgi:cyclophilin family peptidyl-prolyl cis-trans isomerase